MTLILAVIGSSKSGKTTLIEYVTSKLIEEGYRVGTIKHVHSEGFTFDTPGKDTWRYRKAGADVVLGVSDRELWVFSKEVRKVEKVEDLLNVVQRRDLDLIMVEGFKSLTARRRDIIKIVTAKDAEDLEESMKTVSGPIIAVTGPVAKSKLDDEGVKSPAVTIDIFCEGERLIRLIKQLMSR
ncbi:MAG: molybdopterin-guanine dinucleotide biosynthesis protein B [Candidatus Bathyarchaeia archaeon]